MNNDSPKMGIVVVIICRSQKEVVYLRGAAADIVAQTAKPALVLVVLQGVTSASKLLAIGDPIVQLFLDAGIPAQAVGSDIEDSQALLQLQSARLAVSRLPVGHLPCTLVFVPPEDASEVSRLENSVPSAADAVMVYARAGDLSGGCAAVAEGREVFSSSLVTDLSDPSLPAQATLCERASSKGFRLELLPPTLLTVPDDPRYDAPAASVGPITVEPSAVAVAAGSILLAAGAAAIARAVVLAKRGQQKKMG